MQPWLTIDRAQSPDGTELLLVRRGDEWVVRAGGQVLMSSRVHGSEETLVKYALERVTAPRRVLVGGLGLGFTLRAALELLPEDVQVEVVEFVPELTEWNRTHLAAVNEAVLENPRVKVRQGDVYDVIVAAQGTIDLLVLDVDNGPSALTQGGNGRLYSEAGARKCAGALRKGGLLALWSAAADERYRGNLEKAGFSVEMKTVPSRPGSGARDVLFLAKLGGPVPTVPKGPRKTR